MNCLPDDATLERMGADLHELMSAAIAEAGAPWLPHEDDKEHNVAVGKALWLFRTDSPDQAAAFYNVWAAAHGYPGVQVVSLNPLRVDIGTAIGGMIAELRGENVHIATVGNWIRPAGD